MVIHTVIACTTVLLSAAVMGEPEATDEPKELTKLRQDYQERVNAALKPILTGYANNLRVLMKTLTTRGDAKGTLLVAEELKQIQDTQTDVWGSLTIRKATYGVPGAEVDVTAQIKKLVVRNRLSISAGQDNMHFLPDPAFGRIKTLTIEYSQNGKNRTASKVQGEKLSIP
jgi:hypothetical protein